MTFKNLQHSVEDRDRRLAAIAATIAALGERVSVLLLSAQKGRDGRLGETA
jgi:predicted regulator of Ras-like GTPase activity (Roadblock/LC7/MglB family)